ncbi:MAG: AAA family ATPase, partial [Methanobrevibacter sp.]|nr:AAA family ATPase [Methanobrevibacter sp.]
MGEDIMNRLSLGISEFSDLIEQNKIYVDKTRFIKKMMDQGRKYYFLSRPRRFGKSLLVSTFKELFEGNKEPFKDLYIYDKWDWNEIYPVIHLNMGGRANNSPKNLKKSIIDNIELLAEEKEVELKKKLLLEDKFAQLITLLYKSSGRKVVVLIDEYDAPIIDNMNNISLADENRKILQNFYNVLKTSEEYIKFVFVTGI